VERVLVVVIIAVAAVAIAVVVQRRQRPAAPTTTGYNVPDQVDRADFARPDAAWLVAVFTSATCHTCAQVWEKVRLLDSEVVAAAEVELSSHRELHNKYAIDGVPATVVADAEGVVRASFLGPVTATDLWATVAELRAPGTLPSDGCDHGT
jgi:thioredoxin-related protein